MPTLPPPDALLLEYTRSILPKGANIYPITISATTWREYGLADPSVLSSKGGGWTPAHTGLAYLNLMRQQGLL